MLLLNSSGSSITVCVDEVFRPNPRPRVWTMPPPSTWGRSTCSHGALQGVVMAAVPLRDEAQAPNVRNTGRAGVEARGKGLQGASGLATFRADLEHCERSVPGSVGGLQNHSFRQVSPGYTQGLARR